MIGVVITGKKEETQEPPEFSSVARPKSSTSESNISCVDQRKSDISKILETTTRSKTYTSLFEKRVPFKHERSSQHVSRDYTKETVQVGNKTIYCNKKQGKIVVMAIDFGTTYTGYAYSFCDNPQRIYTNYWPGSQIKAPTVVLLDDKRNFHSFGTEAKRTYIELIKKGLHKKWYYFEHFKMKLFVQEGAGIPDEALSLALEPEAASLYCKENLKDVTIKPGTRYIVADLGGGTADFTCHEVNPDNTLKELQKPSGGDYGGITVDHAFRKILNAIFGADVIEMFKESNMEEFYELLTRFEVKKRNFQGGGTMILQFPVSLLEIYEEEVGMPVQNTLMSSPYRGRVEFRQDKIIIQLELAKEIFNEAISKIVEKTTDLFKEVDDLQALVLVGGFSESKFLRNIMMEKFKNRMRVLWPEEPASAVIKGAVINGQQPKAIDSRVCKYTYGIGRMMKFKQNHPLHKLIDINGVAWCDDLFNKHIEIGETVRLDDDFPEKEYFPPTEKMKQAVLMVYASPKKDPKLIDEEGCLFVGLIRVELSGGDVNAKVLVTLVFGGTELRVEAVEEQTGKTTIGHLDFFG